MHFKANLHAQNAGYCISGLQISNIFWGSMPPDPPRDSCVVCRPYAYPPLIYYLTKGPFSKNEKNRNPSVNLDDLLFYARTLDETERQARGIEGANATTSAEYKVHKVISNQIKPPTNRRQSIPRRPQHLKDTTSHKTCFRCGNQWPHQDNSCAAIDQQCKKCLKMNNFARVCKSNRDTRQLAKHSGIHNVIPDSQPDNPIPDSDSDSEPSIYTVSNTTTFGA